MKKQIQVKYYKNKEDFNKLIATPESGKDSVMIIDQLGLALLLMNVYGQELRGVDWSHERGEMFIFTDNPVVRTCIAVWRESIKDDDVMSVTERFLFNLLDYGSHDPFLDLERIEEEKRAWRKDLKKRYPELSINSNKGDESNA